MTNDLYFLRIMAKQKQAQMEKEANLRRLRRLKKDRNSGFGAKIFLKVGDALIRAGEAIKSRYSFHPCMEGGTGCASYDDASRHV
ncbi:MAG: hypothetical protein MI892_03595 [Desulfobacterales bacterium]|nr:hypothetical protein [Desulfobacterales bacterium]